ncbi:hypothetical protein MUP79_00220 [Candidatus Bathyarchaeota archaeon]|nr:hypothetical protein [Candidatus Bathyarchaeota archaeon]
MKKILVVIFAMVMLSAFAAASSSYTKNASGFHVFEDFGVDYNASMWEALELSYPNVWVVDTALGELRYDNYAVNTAVIDAYFLVADDYRAKFQDEWDITIRAKGFDYGDSTWAEITPFFQTTKDGVVEFGSSPYWLHTYVTNLGSYGYGSIWWVLYVGLDGQLIQDYSYLPIGITSTYQDFHFQRRNNPDGTFWIAYYVDNVLYGNQTSAMRGDWSSPALDCGTDPTCIVNVDDFPTDNTYLGFEGYAGYSNHYVTYDYIDVQVYRYANESCTANWQCSTWDNCTNPAPNVSCVAVTDANNCGDEYSGNFSEFGVQACVYPCDPDWSCTGYTETCTSDEQACDEVTDNNMCGEAYSGNYSEFTPLVCCNPSEKGWGSCSRTTLMQEKCVGFPSYIWRTCGYNPYTYGRSTDISQTPNPESVPSFTMETPYGMIQFINPVNTTGRDLATYTAINQNLLFVDIVYLGQTWNSSAWVSIPNILGGCDKFKLWYAPRYFSDSEKIIKEIEKAESQGLLEFNYYDDFKHKFFKVEKQAEKNRIGGNCKDPTVCQSITCSNGTLQFKAMHFSQFFLGSFDYNENDLVPAVINGLAKGLITVGTFATLIMVVLLAGWGMKKIKK